MPKTKSELYDELSAQESLAIPGDPNNFESVVEVANRTGLRRSTAYHWVVRGYFPGTYKGSDGEWRIPRGAWPELNHLWMIRSSLKEFLSRHPILKDYIQPYEYAKKYGFHTNYIWMILDGRCGPAITFPGALRVGRVWFVPADRMHIARKNSEAMSEGIRNRWQQLRNEGLIPAPEVAKRLGISVHHVQRICKMGLVEGAVIYKRRWNVPEDSPFIHDPMFFAENLPSDYKPVPIPNTAIPLIKRLYREGKTQLELADMFRRSRRVIRSRLESDSALANGGL